VQIVLVGNKADCPYDHNRLLKVK